MSYSLKNLFGDNVPAATTSTGNSSKRMVPPTVAKEDGTIEITGFVPSVTIKDWKFDEEKNQLVVTYQDATGATIPGWYVDPEFDQVIQRQEDPSKKEMMTGMRLNLIKRIAQSYVYNNSINNALIAMGDGFSFKQFVETLGTLVLGEENKTNNDVSLKLLFSEANGVEPKYRVGRDNFIGVTGDEKYGPKFTKRGNQYDDVTEFQVIEKTADFDNSNINEIFSTPEINLL